DTLPRLDDRKPEAVAGRKVVNPNAPAGSGAFRTLAEAVAGAKSGDEIWIQHTGRLPTEPGRLEKPNFELTIQAAPHCPPGLALSLWRESDDASLFRVYDGKLTLKGLAFQLEQVQEGHRHQSLVTLLGPGHCVLRDCLVTLAGDDALHLAVVTLADPGSAMKM